MVEPHPIPTDYRFKDLTGRKFGRLTAVAFAGSISGRYCWHCQCDCGAVSIVRAGRLLSKQTVSCGCYGRTQHVKHGCSNGGAEYRIWKHIKDRCCNPNDGAYKNYGGRGIQVCDRWLRSFENFIADMGPRPSRCHSIERKDNNKGYEPSNCCWATRAQQSRNKRNNRWFTHDGQTMTLSEWARHLQMSPAGILTRLNRGMSVGEALSCGRMKSGPKIKSAPSQP